jgi:hypothetical protein
VSSRKNRAGNLPQAVAQAMCFIFRDPTRHRAGTGSYITGRGTELKPLLKSTPYPCTKLHRFLEPITLISHLSRPISIPRITSAVFTSVCKLAIHFSSCPRVHYWLPREASGHLISCNDCSITTAIPIQNDMVNNLRLA